MEKGAVTIASLVEEIRMIPVEQIHLDPGQPRRGVTAEKVAELAGSIRHVGVQVPLILRWDKPARPGDSPGVLLVAGERRLRAAKAAGLATVPAIVRELSDQEARTVQLVENLQREDLTPLEEARGYRDLLELGLSQREVGERVGRTQAHVSNLVRLLDLPSKAQEAVAAGKLTAHHARAFLPLAAYPKILGPVLEEVLLDEPDPAEDLERGLPWMIRRAVGDQARPLRKADYPGQPGALFRAGDAIAIKRLTPVLQKQAQALGTFYHPGPCTTCPHGFRAKTADGLCLEPTGKCYGIRQTFAGSGPKALRAAAEEAKRKTAETTQRKNARVAAERERARWTKTLAQVQAIFRRRRAKPVDLYRRAIYAEVMEWRMDKDRVAVLFKPELEARKMKPQALKEKPLAVLQAMPERRCEELLRTIFALEDAERRSWGGRDWAFIPPVKGLRIGL